MAHSKSTRAQKEYVKAVVNQLSLQRLSDGEIVDYLAEKGIILARNTVNRIKKQIERQAAKWYIELKQSQSKYIANYKERLDSLLAYQKILNDIIKTTKREDIKIKAISPLHSIQMDIFNLWKQLPDLDIVERVRQVQNQQDQEPTQEDPPIVSIEDINGVGEIPEEDKGLWHNWIQCDGCKRYWRDEELLDYHKRKSTNTSCAIPNIE
jgi:hypothetical protein